MPSRSWVRSLFSSKPSRSAFSHYRRPQLEVLEDRTVPASTRSLLASPLAPEARTAQARQGVAVLLSVRAIDNTTLLLRFNGRLGKSASNPAAYSIPGLTILRAQVARNRRSVFLTTTPQENRPYTVSVSGIRTQDGATVVAPPRTTTVVGGTATTTAPQDTTPPRVVGAVSISNTRVVVSFSEPVGTSAIDPQNYAIRQTTVNPDAGFLRITAAAFADAAHTSVVLTTLSQNDLGYTLRAIGVQDLAGNAPGAPVGFTGGLIDPAAATFIGTAAPGGLAIDTDGDGLTDNVEQRGWTVTYKTLQGTTVTRGVSSDPLSKDSDADGLDDRQELNLALDPRNKDTDLDQLSDSQEYNEIFSDPLSQDTDGDGLDDAVEFNFFRTSVVQADTDGDQLPDGDEVLLANRNPRVADLPTPAIEVGDMNLQLDVRFTETTSQGSKEVESRTVDSKLTQSNKKEMSNSNSNTQQAFVKLAAGFEFENSAKFGTDGIGGGVSNKFKVNAESGWTGTWTSDFKTSSVAETQNAYGQSLNTNAEVTQGATVVRDVKGARVSVTVFLKNASTLAYNISNLQITAFIQDPQSPGSLTPLATLLPENAPKEGFNLGPLVPERGPFIFSSDTVFANQVEQLMKNPTGVVFKIANFDIKDELGRNFAFSSKDIFDRTSSLVIDYGGFDSDSDGEGDLTENFRVATDGGRVIDTNGDNKVDAKDHRVVFDANGKQVGLSLRDALAAIGLTRYDEKVNPTATLTDDQLRTSYSTVIDQDGIERIARIRTVGPKPGERRAWVVLTPTGIDPSLGLDNTILTTASDVKIAYVLDLDGDRVPANVEAIFGTSDTSKDTDGDGLDDRFETLVGWDVDLGAQGTRHVFSRGNSTDADQDGLSDSVEAPAARTFDANGLIVSAVRSNPSDVISDPTSPDTDADGVSDGDEFRGFTVNLRSGGTVTVQTDPANPDTDGDSASDGLERRLGGNPTNAGDRNTFADDDGDGLTNIEETTGWDVVLKGTVQTVHVTSNPQKADTDADGIPDAEEAQLKTNPGKADTDGDGLTDFQEVRGFKLRDQGIIKTDPLDADTDDDKRSDGDEAELVDVESKRWIVQPVGKTPYRVYSDPLQADADFDGVVDGDEYAWNNGLYRSDPNKANTDGDSRTDGEEWRVGLNPLVEDFRITVVYRSLLIQADGDGGGDTGDFSFEFDVRLPSETSVTGMANPTIIVSSGLVGSAMPMATGNTQSLVWNENVGAVQIGDGVLLNLPDWLTSLGSRSISFSLAKNQRFSIEGAIDELDAGTSKVTVNYGGLEGVKATKDGGTEKIRSVFDGESLTLGSVTELTFAFDTADNVGQTGGGTIKGELKAMIIVS